MSAQGHTEKESLEFCKMDLINDRANKEIKDYWRLQDFKFETIISWIINKKKVRIKMTEKEKIKLTKLWLDMNKDEDNETLNYLGLSKDDLDDNGDMMDELNEIMGVE
jgi:hypothetical protein